MSWYRSGTVNVTKNNKTVIGVGTFWANVVNTGDTFALVDANGNPTGVKWICKMSYPEAYDGFIFTDGFRSSTVTYGATNSRHKFGLAFDWGYKRLECLDLETVYYVLGKHGICCPLSSWNGQDEGMHMELASSQYTGTNPADNLYPKTESV